MYLGQFDDVDATFIDFVAGDDELAVDMENLWEPTELNGALRDLPTRQVNADQRLGIQQGNCAAAIGKRETSGSKCFRRELGDHRPFFALEIETPDRLLEDDHEFGIGREWSSGCLGRLRNIVWKRNAPHLSLIHI